MDPSLTYDDHGTDLVITQRPNCNVEQDVGVFICTNQSLLTVYICFAAHFACTEGVRRN